MQNDYFPSILCIAGQYMVRFLGMSFRKEVERKTKNFLPCNGLVAETIETPLKEKK